jgi:hypothetical protein
MRNSRLTGTAHFHAMPHDRSEALSGDTGFR